MKTYPVLQIIAGSDSCGGAGIQADIKTATSLGVYSMTAITALTAQNTCGVNDILDINEKFVRSQLETNLSDIPCDAVKIGMLHKTSLIIEIKDFLLKHKLKNIVLDPVMVAASKAILLEESAIKSLKEDLFPLVDIITPNLYEANLLFNKSIKNKEDAKEACIYLSSYGCKYVLIKSLELGFEYSYDCLYESSSERFTFYKNPRILTKNTHGTGCSLSSAIASFLAKGLIMQDAVKQANLYVYEAIKAGSLYKIGKNRGAINHMYKI